MKTRTAQFFNQINDHRSRYVRPRNLPETEQAVYVLRLMKLSLVMMFVASNKDCFCSVGYLPISYRSFIVYRYG